MSYDNKSMITSGDGKLAPQVFNPDTDKYEVLQGSAEKGMRVQQLDGADVSAGAKSDPAITDPLQAASRTGLLKGLLTVLNSLLARFVTGTVIGKVEQGAGAGNALSPWYTQTADGDNDTLGAQNDAPKTDHTQSGSVISWLKGLVAAIVDAWDPSTHRFKVSLQSAGATGQAAPATANLVGGQDNDSKQRAIHTSRAGDQYIADKVDTVIGPVILDFKDKVAADVVKVPHVAKWRSATTVGDPTTFTTELATYSAMSSLDGTTALTGPTTQAGGIPQHEFEFDILAEARRRLNRDVQASELATLVKALSFTWSGWGVGASGGVATNGATLKVWGPLTNTWNDINTNNTAGPSPITYSPSQANAVSKLDANGVIRFVACVTNPSDGVIGASIYTDYPQCQVTFAGQTIPVRAESTLRDPDGQQRQAAGDRSGRMLLGSIVRQLAGPQTLDFATPTVKLAGVTGDNPHVARQLLSGTATAVPSAFSSEVSNTGYSQLAYANDAASLVTTTSIAGQYPLVLLIFDVWEWGRRNIRADITVPELRAAIQALSATVTYSGVGVNGGATTNSASGRIWNASTQAWNADVTNTAATPTAANVYSTSNPTLIANLLGDDGKVYVELGSTYPSDGVTAATLTIEYPKLDIKFKAEYVQEMIALAMARDGNAAPSHILQVGGKDTAGALRPVGMVTTAADGQALALNRQTMSAVQMAFNGAALDMVRVPTVFKVINLSVPAGGEAVLWAPATGKKVRTMGMTLASSVDSAGNIDIRDGAGGQRFLTHAGLAKQAVPYLLGQGKLAAAANNAVVAYNTTASPISLWGIVWGTEE